MIAVVLRALAHSRSQQQTHGVCHVAPLGTERVIVAHGKRIGVMVDEKVALQQRSSALDMRARAVNSPGGGDISDPNLVVEEE